MAVTVTGAPEVVFTRAQACDDNDIPDSPVRAIRLKDGSVAVFGMHYNNRLLRGDTLQTLKLDCQMTLVSNGKSDPTLYDDKSWITAPWTQDGETIYALVHHEYQANSHPGRCRSSEYLACWYNSIIAVRSNDGGKSFQRPLKPIVVASAPFRQDIEQGRHRGFFNPSNIVSDGVFFYFLAGTTGWKNQNYGACLFRTDTPSDPRSWRAYDGIAFSIRYGDPYQEKLAPQPCQPIAPFPAPVGSLSRLRHTNSWVAVFQASAQGELFPEPGFYATSSKDLIHWDKPRLILGGKTLYDDPCTSKGSLISYPSLLDKKAVSRHFEDISEKPDLYYTHLKVEGCAITSDRSLIRREVVIKELVKY